MITLFGFFWYSPGCVGSSLILLVIIVLVTGMSYRPSLLFLNSFITNLSSLNTFRFLLSSSTLQSSSHNWPMDINDELNNYGRTVSCCAFFDR